MEILSEVLHLAGFALAHALWSTSDLEGEDLLCPLAVVHGPNGRELVRFEANSQEEAIRAGKSATSRYTGERSIWAFARDGIIRESGQAIDVITVECWAPEMEVSVTILQAYVPYSTNHQFRLRGAPQLVVNGSVVNALSAAPALGIVQQGLESHSHVAQLLPQWVAAQTAG